MDKETLTEEQQAKLGALLAELETLPTPELIVEATRLQGVDLATEEGRARHRTAMAGQIAAEKMLSYLVMLRHFETLRNDLGRSIAEYKTRPFPTRIEELDEYALANVIAFKNAGLQEVACHFFCNCVMHLHKLLKKAAAAAGYEIPEEELSVLGEYRELRNYFEHIENRLPGEVHAAEAVRESFTDDGWHIESGLEIDDQGRILHKGQAIDVTARGLSKIEDVVIKTWEALRPAALDGARKYFLTCPDAIPPPSDVRQAVMVSLGGPNPGP